MNSETKKLIQDLDGAARFAKYSAVAFAIACLIPSALWGGWVSAKLWAWFIVPVFDVRPITVLQAIGIGIAFGAFTIKPYKKSPPTTGADIFAATVYAFIVPSILLATGWVVRLAM